MKKIQSTITDWVEYTGRWVVSLNCDNLSASQYHLQILILWTNLD
jgi:hypothetical protein